MYISKTKRLYTDGELEMAKSAHFVTLIIYINTLKGFRRFLWTLYIQFSV